MAPLLASSPTPGPAGCVPGETGGEGCSRRKDPPSAINAFDTRAAPTTTTTPSNSTPSSSTLRQRLPTPPPRPIHDGSGPDVGAVTWDRPGHRRHRDGIRGPNRLLERRPQLKKTQERHRTARAGPRGGALKVPNSCFRCRTL
eukprot:gene22696-biopygen23760